MACHARETISIAILAGGECHASRGSYRRRWTHTKFGTHSLRRTKAVLIYRRTGNLRAVQLYLGHSKIESTVRYLGIELDDAIEIAEKIDI